MMSRLATQLSCKKAHFCDRHHIASAMAELASYLWIVPYMRSFYVPPKYSAPLTRGFFRRSSAPAAAVASVIDAARTALVARSLKSIGIRPLPPLLQAHPDTRRFGLRSIPDSGAITNYFALQGCGEL